MAEQAEELSVIARVVGKRVTAALSISRDRLKLFLECQRVEGSDASQQISVAEISALLEPHVPLEVLDGSVLEDIARSLNQHKNGGLRRIAKGIAPVDGDDGRLVLCVKLFDPKALKHEIRGDNIRTLHLFDNVSAGQVVGRVIHPTTGMDGRDVFNKPLPAKPGRPYKLETAKQIRVDVGTPEPGVDTLVALDEGYLLLEEGRLKLSNHLVIERDVDFSVGNVDFPGSVEVRGNVLKDFSLSAKRDITVSGSVQDGYVCSREGCVSIHANLVAAYVPERQEATDRPRAHFVSRRQRPNVAARGKLSVFRVQGAVVDVEGDIEVAKEIMNSSVRTGGAVLIPNGQLFGGVTYCARGVEARFIGSTAGSRTVIEILSAVESSSRFGEIEQSLAAFEEAASRLLMQAGPLVKDPQLINSLPEPSRSKAVALLEKLKQVEVGMTALVAEREELKLRAAQQGRSVITFHGMMFRGTEVSAQGAAYKCEGDTAGPRSLVYDPKGKTFELTSAVKLPEGRPRARHKPGDAAS